MGKKIRTLTMYLPQFYRTKENDEWWGEGYTEWTAVRNAKPLFKGHMQPKKPLNDNYYNLLNKETMIWQSELMSTYGIDGQCFYHYYFKNGRKILEKPAENLLKWKEINMPFCFCWANQSWTRTWSTVRGNSWADSYEKVKYVEQNGMLLEQKYGREKEWKNHLEYLIPFFMDDRYIKLEGKPIFMIYEYLEIPCLCSMIDYWNEIMLERGLPNIYFIGMNASANINKMDAILLHAPFAYWNINRSSDLGGILTDNYANIWDNIIKKPPLNDAKTYFEGVVNCDDTPRRGKNGVCLSGFSTEIFLDGMCKLYRKSIALNNEFVFINAWNEWGEGMYLEPDQTNQYKYLECVKEAQKEFETSIEENEIKTSYEFIEQNSKYKQILLQFEREKRNAKCLDVWMTLKENRKNVGDCLLRFDVKSIAIYGMGILGKHLLNDLKDSSIEIKYIIDQSSNLHHPQYKVISPDDEYESVDAIIVTPIWDMDRIYDKLKKKTKSKIFSVEEILIESQ